jgi:hypothetical protein
LGAGNGVYIGGLFADFMTTARNPMSMTDTPNMGGSLFCFSWFWLGKVPLDGLALVLVPENTSGADEA